jgi:hypothetical protein
VFDALVGQNNLGSMLGRLNFIRHTIVNIERSCSRGCRASSVKSESGNDGTRPANISGQFLVAQYPMRPTRNLAGVTRRAVLLFFTRRPDTQHWPKPSLN